MSYQRNAHQTNPYRSSDTTIGNWANFKFFFNNQQTVPKPLESRLQGKEAKVRATNEGTFNSSDADYGEYINVCISWWWGST